MDGYTGVVKSFNDSKGWGFIECVETQQIYGKDILFQKSELQGASVSKGDQISFAVTQGRNGPIAVSLQLYENLPVVPVYARDGVVAMGTAMGAGERFGGRIKSYNAEKGWGFIECDQTQQIYGKDIIVIRSELGAVQLPEVGQPVVFSVAEGRKGPIAVAVDLKAMRGGAGAAAHRPRIGAPPSPYADPRRAWVPMQPPQWAQAPPAYQYRLGVANPAAGAIGGMPYGAQPRAWAPAAAAPAPAPGTVETICGLVKSFDEQKGWGFVHGEAIQQIFGKDVYLSRGSLQGQTVTPGDQVKFTVQMGMKGPMANAVTVLPSGSFGADGAPGNTFAGTVKSFQPEKGWGFVTSEEVMQLFGKDLFLHKRELGDASFPSAGDPVQFSVQLNRKGQPEATGISFSATEYLPVRTKPTAIRARGVPY